MDDTKPIDEKLDPSKLNSQVPFELVPCCSAPAVVIVPILIIATPRGPVSLLTSWTVIKEATGSPVFELSPSRMLVNEKPLSLGLLLLNVTPAAAPFTKVGSPSVYS